MLGEHVVHVVEDDLSRCGTPSCFFSRVPACQRAALAAQKTSWRRSRHDRGAQSLLWLTVRLPGMDGLALQRYLFSRGAEPAIVMITGHGDIALAVAALKAGAMDFVTKPFNPAELLDSVREAWRRSADARQRAVAAAENEALFQTLTPRETSILTRLAEGQSSKLIAAALGISVRTVEHHRASIMEKLRVRTLSQLIRSALGKSG